MHISDSVLDSSGMIDQHRLRHVARLGGDWYASITSSNLFQVPKPNTQLGIGIDALPLSIRNSSVLTGNDLGLLANVHEYPVIDPAFRDARLSDIHLYFSVSPVEMERELHLYAASLLQTGKVFEAWQVLLSAL